MTAINELDVVRLVKLIPYEELEVGEIGTVVAVYEGVYGGAYEVEFIRPKGSLVITLTSDTIEKI